MSIFILKFPICGLIFLGSTINVNRLIVSLTKGSFGGWQHLPFCMQILGIWRYAVSLTVANLLFIVDLEFFYFIFLVCKRFAFCRLIVFL